MSDIETIAPKIVEAPPEYSGRYMTVVRRSPVSVPETMRSLMASTGCTVDEAYASAWEIHMTGESAVYFASREICAVVASLLMHSRLICEVRPEFYE